jgi:hypothetical protein
MESLYPYKSCLKYRALLDPKISSEVDAVRIGGCYKQSILLERASAERAPRLVTNSRAVREEFHVERISQFGLFELGQTLERLRNFKGDIPPGDVFVVLMSASKIMEKLRKNEPLPITVSLERARELENKIDELLRERFYPPDIEGKSRFKWPGAEDENISEWRWKQIIADLEKFETVFAEDMRENATYYVPRRGIFFTKALVDAAHEAFPADLLPYIPRKTLEDWCAAGRCLAFNLLSASGFHVARAVEGILEAYYQLFCGKQPADTLNSWNEYIVALEAVGNSGAAKLDRKTLAELRQMKDDFRNPIAHPRITLNEANAKILFNNGESLIIAMAQEIKDATEKAQPSLSLISALAADS